MSRLMVSISGIRGVVGESFTPRAVERFAYAFGRWARGDAESATVVIGRDSRPSGPMVTAAASAGLMAAGCEVIDVGLAPTPTIMLRVEHAGAAGGLAITASHNPAPWNALKLIGPRGMFLTPDEAAALFVLHDSLDADEMVPWNEVGSIRQDDGAIRDHIDRILALSCVNVAAIRDRHFRVALDCGRGAGGVITPTLLEELGCEVIGIDLEADGQFSRNPEPVPENLGELCRRVLEVGADVGLAHDADVDRLAIVTEKGEAVGEECTLALAVSHLLSTHRAPVVTNLSTSSMVERLCARAGVPFERTSVGEIHVASRMRELGSAIGGEGNGGVIVPELHFTRDAPAAAAVLLSLLAEREASPSSLVEELPRLPMLKTKFDLAGAAPVDLAERLGSVLPGAEVDLRDGVRLARGDAWIHVRASNTEPILRVIGEAGSEEEIRALADLAAAAAGGV